MTRRRWCWQRAYWCSLLAPRGTSRPCAPAGWTQWTLCAMNDREAAAAQRSRVPRTEKRLGQPTQNRQAGDAAHRVQLIGRGLRLGWVDLDAALEVGAVLDADPRRRNISDDGAILLDVDATACMEIAHDFAVNNHLARVDFRNEIGSRAHGQFMAAKRNGPFDFAVDLQIFGAGDMTLDLQACPQARSTARGRLLRRGAEGALIGVTEDASPCAGATAGGSVCVCCFV